MEPGTKTEEHRKLVEVSLAITDENGETRVESKSIPGGPTEVLHLKSELGVAPETALWVVRKNGKKSQLADHASHNVKDGDRYEALVRGGIS